MAASYKALGKSYAAQRDFRHRWVMQELAEERKKRVMTEQQQVTNTTKAVYLPAGKIYHEEGSDAAALDATASYIAEAIRRWQRNETLQGRPYVLKNAWTKRHEFLYVKEYYEESFSRTQAEVTIQTGELKVASNCTGHVRGEWPLFMCGGRECMTKPRTLPTMLWHHTPLGRGRCRRITDMTRGLSSLEWDSVMCLNLGCPHMLEDMQTTVGVLKSPTASAGV